MFLPMLREWRDQYFSIPFSAKSLKFSKLRVRDVIGGCPHFFKIAAGTSLGGSISIFGGVIKSMILI